MKRIFSGFFGESFGILGAIFAAFFALFLAACGDEKVDSAVISSGSVMSKEAREIEQNLDKHSYAELADLFLDTATISFDKNVLLIFGKNGCIYCDKLKADIKNSPQMKALIREHFNPYYINTSYAKTHAIAGVNPAANPANAANLANPAAKNAANPANPPAASSPANPPNPAQVRTAELALAFNVNSTPLVAFVAKNGEVKYIFPGYTPAFERLLEDVVRKDSAMGNYGAINAKLSQIYRAAQNAAAQTKTPQTTPNKDS